MKAKKYMVALLLIGTLTLTVSCSKANIENEASKTKDDIAEIKIDVMEREHYLLDAIKKFNENHEAVKISYDTIARNEESKNKYITKLSTGESADIIRIEPWIFSAVNKVADSGIFYDINEFINKDKNFELSDYNQKVLDSGIINGKRVFIPLGYSFKAFYAKNNVLEENGFVTEGSDWTLEYLADKASSFMQKNKDSGKIYMVSYKFNLSDIVKCSGLKLIDYEKKRVTTNSPEFINLMNIYKKMYSTVKDKGNFSSTGIMSEEFVEMTSDYSEINNGTALTMDNKVEPQWFKDGLNKILNVYLFPQYTSEKSILLEPMLSFAINSKSNYKKEAYEFLKLILSEEYQNSGKRQRNFSYIPVNNNAYLNNVNFYISNLGNNQTVNGEYNAEKRKAKVKEQYQEIQKISVCDTVDAQVYDIIDTEAKNFIDGKYSAEKTAEIIQEKVMLYLNE